MLSYPEVYADITGKYDFTDFAEGKLAYSIVDGKNYGIPFDAGTVVGTYRTDYLAEAGYTIEDVLALTSLPITMKRSQSILVRSAMV